MKNPFQPTHHPKTNIIALLSYHKPCSLACCLVALGCILSLTGCSAPADAVTDEATNTPTAITEPDETAANFVISAQARLTDTEDRTWHDTLETHSGDRVEIQIQYANFDTAKHNNVAMFISLPQGLTYVPNSTRLFNAEHSDGYTPDRDSIALGEGITMGNYNGTDTNTGNINTGEPASNAFVRFTVTVDDATTDTLLVTRYLVQTYRDGNKNPTIRDGFISIAALTDASSKPATPSIEDETTEPTPKSETTEAETANNDATEPASDAENSDALPTVDLPF